MDNREIQVVGVRFKEVGKIYYFDPDDMELEKEEEVIVETARGKEYGQVVVGPRWVSEKEIKQPLKKIIRRVTQEDREKIAKNREDQIQALDICEKKIESHKLPMKLVDAEYTFDRSKIIFYFTAEGRVDFRNLVKDLASVFRTRIELRQIGVRDEAKMIGGLGSCGRELCCSTFLGDFETVSIKMAKEQNLSLNPNKISGICGRLMCCLKYENKTYEAQRKKMPRQGSRVKTPYGVGIVDNVNLLQEMMIIKFAEGKREIVDLEHTQGVAKDTPLDVFHDDSLTAYQEIRLAKEGRKRKERQEQLKGKDASPSGSKDEASQTAKDSKKTKEARGKWKGKNAKNRSKKSRNAKKKTRPADARSQDRDKQGADKKKADKRRPVKSKKRPAKSPADKRKTDQPDRGRHEDN